MVHDLAETKLFLHKVHRFAVQAGRSGCAARQGHIVVHIRAPIRFPLRLLVAEGHLLRFELLVLSLLAMGLIGVRDGLQRVLGDAGFESGLLDRGAGFGGERIRHFILVCGFRTPKAVPNHSPAILVVRLRGKAEKLLLGDTNELLSFAGALCGLQGGLIRRQLVPAAVLNEANEICVLAGEPGLRGAGFRGRGVCSLGRIHNVGSPIPLPYGGRKTCLWRRTCSDPHQKSTNLP